MIETTIENKLKVLNIPFEFGEYTGNANTYIMYALPIDMPVDFVDDKHNKEEATIIVTLWTNRKYDLSLYKDIIGTMVDDDIQHRNTKTIKDKDYYAKVMEFTFNKEV